VLDLFDELAAGRDDLRIAIRCAGEGGTIAAFIGREDRVREAVDAAGEPPFAMRGPGEGGGAGFEAVPPYPDTAAAGLRVQWRSVVFGTSGMDAVGRGAVEGLLDQGADVRLDPIFNPDDVHEE
jgi:hypothetical protein